MTNHNNTSPSTGAAGQSKTSTTTAGANQGNSRTSSRTKSNKQ